MSDRKSSFTPIIVGAVIALLGILTGLYIATNAREQQEAQLSKNEAAASGNVEQADDQFATEQTTLPELPEVEEMPQPEMKEPLEPDVVTEVVPEVPEVTTVDTPNDEPDDFTPVSPEEIEQALPHQQDSI